MRRYRRNAEQTEPAYGLRPIYQEPTSTAHDLAGLVCMGLVINPKTKQPVLATTDGEYVSIRAAEAAAPWVKIGTGYHSTNSETATDVTGYPRVHTPEGVKRKGMGYGTSLYTALCLGSKLVTDGAVQISMARRPKPGISSAQEDRSREASAWWESAVDRGLAEREESEGDTYTEEYVKLHPSAEELQSCLGSDLDEGEISYVNEVSVDIVKPGEATIYDFYTFDSATEHHLVAMSFAVELPRLNPGAEFTYIWRTLFDANEGALFGVDWTALLALDVRGLDRDLIKVLAVGYLVAGASEEDVDNLWYRYEHDLDPEARSTQGRLFKANAAEIRAVAEAREATGWADLADLP